MSDAPDVTAIVCTYNRRARVLRTCEALAQQDYPGRRYEVIVVDNASTDDTREAIPRFAAQAPVPFHYLYEGQAGKTHALNAAIAVARGRFLAFVDDDCAPRPDWLRTLLAPFADDPSLGAVCGPVYSRFPEEVERSAEQRFLAHRFLGDFTLGEARRELQGRESPLGCNLATPTDLTRQIGGYSVRFGPAPGRLGLYEDTEFIQRNVSFSTSFASTSSFCCASPCTLMFPCAPSTPSNPAFCDFDIITFDASPMRRSRFEKMP